MNCGFAEDHSSKVFPTLLVISIGYHMVTLRGCTNPGVFLGLVSKAGPVVYIRYTRNRIIT